METKVVPVGPLIELQGLSLQGPPADQDTLRRYNSEYVIRDDKHSEHLIHSTRKLRSSWSNITSGSIISRKNKNHVINGDTTDNLQDVRKTELFDSVTPKTPDITARTEKKKHTTFITDEVVDYKDNTTISDIPDNITTISEESEEEDVDDVDSENDDDDKEDQDNSFKVDFKVDESHAELHLFLPKISSGNKSAKTNRTDEFDESSSKTDRSGPIVLPSIKVDSIHQIKAYQNPPGRKLKRQDTFRKKKKKTVERIKSAADPDKKVRDHLNDVHTLISIQDHHSSHTTDTVCHFENCPYHSLLPQTQESTS
ncbi:unnamed protein product [Mytilus coruscus]|uniref:Uncharacterized protein n=1 Tax=Mytilus coruscus TaxID=42192 RepID=A0A6J8DQA3_MYTCO|nr:unnamed protein product [Mytilus coruscus]